MIEQRVPLLNKLGLHIRASSQLVDCALRFNCETLIRYKKRTIDAKSIMQVMGLGATQHAVLTFITSGVDEEEAMNALVKLINNRFGETA